MIRIRKKGLKVFFEEVDKIEEKDKLNVTNILNFKEIIFEKKRLNDNFIKTFLKELFEKENIELVNIQFIDYIPIVFPIISSIPCIKEIIIEETKIIPSNLCNEFKKLNYIQKINCYQMTSFLFEECINKKIEVNYRKKEFIKSNFMIHNDLFTLSKIFYKKNIVVYESLTKEDFLDFEYFLEENKNLSKIECYGYSNQILKELITKLLDAKKKNITIIIYQKKDEQKEIEDILAFLNKVFKKDFKNSNIKIEIKYTKKYKDKYYLKQVNLNIFRIILIILLIFTTSIYIISKIHIYNSEKVEDEVKKLVEEKEEVKEEIETSENNQENTTNTIQKEENKKTEEKKEIKEKTYTKDFKNLIKINSEFVTWLTVPNTSISYPVVKHKDNEYYLNHSYDKSYNISGWIFMDYRNKGDFTDQNTIIYGHDSYSTTMFGTLKKILNKNWYTKNKTITLESDNKKISAEIISIYTIDNTNDYIGVVFSQKEFQNFIDKIVKRSIYNFNNKPTINDKIITLSTCYKDSKQRLVLHAKIK